MTDQQIDEFLEMLAKSPTSARDMVRGLFSAHEAKAAPAVPRCIPAQDVIDAIEAWKSAWLKVPPFADRVNKATREAITISHNSLFLLLQSAQQAQRMPAGCTTPTGCGPHGCHGACIAATPAAPSHPAVPQGWQVERRSDYRIRVRSPSGEAWSFEHVDDRGSANLFVYQMLDAMLAAPSQPVTLTDEYAGVIAWVGDKQCKRVLTEGAIKHEHTPGVAMRNTAHQCVQEVIIAALREKQGGV